MRMADEKEKLAARAALAGDKLPMYFAALEKIMVANGNDNNFQFHEKNFKTNYFYEFLYVLILEILFHQITTFIKVFVAFFGLPTL